MGVKPVGGRIWIDATEADLVSGFATWVSWGILCLHFNCVKARNTWPVAMSQILTSPFSFPVMM